MWLWWLRIKTDIFKDKSYSKLISTIDSIENDYFKKRIISTEERDNKLLLAINNNYSTNWKMWEKFIENSTKEIVELTGISYEKNNCLNIRTYSKEKSSREFSITRFIKHFKKSN